MICVSTGKALFPGTSTMNQIDRVMSCIPRPNRIDVESLKSPYAQSMLDQLIRRYVCIRHSDYVRNNMDVIIS